MAKGKGQGRAKGKTAKAAAAPKRSSRSGAAAWLKTCIIQFNSCRLCVKLTNLQVPDPSCRADAGGTQPPWHPGPTRPGPQVPYGPPLLPGPGLPPFPPTMCMPYMGMPTTMRPKSPAPRPACGPLRPVTVWVDDEGYVHPPPPRPPPLDSSSPPSTPACRRSLQGDLD